MLDSRGKRSKYISRIKDLLYYYVVQFTHGENAPENANPLQLNTDKCHIPLLYTALSPSTGLMYTHPEFQAARFILHPR